MIFGGLLLLYQAMFLKYSIVHIIIATAFDEFDFYYRYDFQSTFFINIFYCLQYQYSFSSFTRLLLALYILIDLVITEVAHLQLV